MPRRPTDAELARQLLRDATSASKRGSPARRVFARSVLDAVFNRALAEDPDRVRRDAQAILLAVHRRVLAGSAEAIAFYRVSAAKFRADGFDVPSLPDEEDES